MYFSGKISNSFINYLERSGLDLEPALEVADIPLEFLKDPSCWLEADKLEKFLKHVESVFCESFPGEDLVEIVGHDSHGLKSWGGLDSVLKMVSSPQDIFLQPERFLSYFISPTLSLSNIKKTEKSISFDFPVSASDYPFVCSYLKSAMESLPSFMNSEMARVSWERNSLEINWDNKQNELFSEEKAERNVTPELMQELMLQMEKTEQKLREKNQQCMSYEKEKLALEQELKEYKTKALEEKLSGVTSSLGDSSLSENFEDMKQDLMRLCDYFSRSQQLVTLLVGQDKETPQVREAMRRVNWEYIKLEHPKLISQSLKSLEDLRKKINSSKPKKQSQVNEDFNGELLSDGKKSQLTFKISRRDHVKN